jgi:hypothetical protein
MSAAISKPGAEGSQRLEVILVSQVLSPAPVLVSRVFAPAPGSVVMIEPRPLRGEDDCLFRQPQDLIEPQTGGWREDPAEFRTYALTLRLA